MNYTLAMEACILITLYRCSGEWVSIEQIAARLRRDGYASPWVTQ